MFRSTTNLTVDFDMQYHHILYQMWFQKWQTDKDDRCPGGDGGEGGGVVEEYDAGKLPSAADWC